MHRHFTEEDTWMGNKHQKYSVSIAIREMKINTAMVHHIYQNGYNENSSEEKLGHSYFLVRM